MQAVLDSVSSVPWIYGVYALSSLMIGACLSSLHLNHSKRSPSTSHAVSYILMGVCVNVLIDHHNRRAYSP